jgi:ubiquinone/menaquinone biosynthesis C-methylase UbiE
MTIARYDEIAAWYDESIRRGSLIHDLYLPSLFELVGAVAGQQICDLACGQGVVARRLAERGARVIGIDLSEKLLAIARRDEATEPLGIVYRHGDAQDLGSMADTTFDGVVCNIALMDIPDLAAVFGTVERILRPGGWFAFTITHPCFQTPAARWLDTADGPPARAVSGYFDEGYWRSDYPHGVRGQVGAYHRTLSTYFNTLIAAGLTLERLVEPPATGPIAKRLPGYAEVPAVLVALCRKR